MCLKYADFRGSYIIYLPIFFRVTSLALGLSYTAIDTTLTDLIDIKHNKKGYKSFMTQLGDVYISLTKPAVIRLFSDSIHFVIENYIFIAD